LCSWTTAATGPFEDISLDIKQPGATICPPLPGATSAVSMIIELDFLLAID
jgi:hypothetical protein